MVDDAFFGRVGHDLRGELATMLAGVHYVLRYEGELSPTAREMLVRVRGAGNRLKTLLDEFNNCVWLQPTEHPPLQLESYTMDDLCAGALERAQQAAAARGVVPVLENEAKGGNLTGDVELLGVAVGFVLDLAIARSRDQPVTLLARTEAGHGLVTVLDHAGNVADDQLARILDPFVEKEVIPKETPSRGRERLGLGLSIARGILQAHGGSLRVAPAPGAPGLAMTCDLGSVHPG